MRGISNLAVLLVAAVMSLSANLSAVAAKPVESLNYRVMFKWGLVNKQAGTVNLSTFSKNGGSRFEAILTAKSAKWADHFYEVRDTLKGEMNASTVEPSFYEKISHEGGHFKHDRLTYTRSGSHVKADCHRIDQPKPGKPAEESSITLEAEGLTLDMLSSFYYMRRIDYESMKPGETKVLTVFSGTKKETLTISYDGVDDVEIDGEKMPAYRIKFRFTGKGGKKTSDDMYAWISTGEGGIPLKLVGKLPVGQVQCYYIPPGR